MRLPHILALFASTAGLAWVAFRRLCEKRPDGAVAGTEGPWVWVELLFMARGTEEALGMSRPRGDARWDVGVNYERLHWKVKVKSTEFTRRAESYSLNVMGPGRKPYRDQDVDFVAVYLIPRDTWYIIPYKEMVRKNGKKLCTLHFTWGSKRQKWGKYREAWWLLRGEEKPKRKRKDRSAPRS